MHAFVYLLTRQHPPSLALLPADTQLGVLVACSVIGTVLRCLILHYTTDTTDIDRLYKRSLVAHPVRHYLSLFALLLAQSAVWTHWIFR